MWHMVLLSLLIVHLPSKPDLLELADTLGISLEDACNNQECIECIQSHLDSHPNLKENPSFTGLYL